MEGKNHQQKQMIMSWKDRKSKKETNMKREMIKR